MIKQKKISHGKLIKEHSDSEKINSEDKKPVFSFQYLQSNWCISHCEKHDKASLADQLRMIGQQTWAELRQNHRHKLGYEKIIRDAIRASVPHHLKDEVVFLAFRFSGLKPMVGYREKEVFHILWIDRNFTLYKH